MSDLPVIHPVILCGGSGTRLWPLSRKSYPKQFSNLLGDSSLFQASVMRVAGQSFADPLVVAGEDFRFIVAEQLASVHIKPACILVEPEGRNTAPAILAAALKLAQDHADDLMLVCPSDHVIPDTAAFRTAVLAAVDAAQKGDLVTFGIKPTRPETGYGYLHLDPTPSAGANQPVPLAGFVEKPDAARAVEMLTNGCFLWNAGIFMFRIGTILDAYRDLEPQMFSDVSAAVEGAQADLGLTRLAQTAWSAVQDVSIDYAIMEHAERIVAMPFDAGWSDLGGWEAVWQESNPDAAGNVCSDHATAIDCMGTLLRSESEGLEVVGIGLENIVAIAMPDAVLIANRSDSQRVKQAVSILQARGSKQATAFPRDHRPWGWFESLAVGDRFQVKRIVVHPGASLSLQSHFHRSEHWIVVEGTAKVTIDDRVQLVTENQSVYIPLGAVHRLENPGKFPMVLIEVQTGGYLGEDDIVRHEDVYARK